MQTSTQLTVMITLTLTQGEAEWLHDCMQNYLGDQAHAESAIDQQRRETLFISLTRALEGLK